MSVQLRRMQGLGDVEEFKYSVAVETRTGGGEPGRGERLVPKLSPFH